VLQGDGINIHTLEKILDAVLEKGFSAEVGSFAVCTEFHLRLTRHCIALRMACDSPHFNSDYT